MSESQDDEIIRLQQQRAAKERIPLDDTRPNLERSDLDARSAEARAAAARGEVSYAEEQQDAILKANRAASGEPDPLAEADFAADMALGGQGGGLARRGRSLLGD